MRIITPKRPGLAPPIRVGLLGAGGISDAHAMSLASLPGVEMVGVADVDPTKARRLSERWSAGPPFPSLEALMKGGRPDVVHILLPPEHHARFAIEAMAAGAHVFVEKPLCISASECREVEAAAEQYE